MAWTATTNRLLDNIIGNSKSYIGTMVAKVK